MNRIRLSIREFIRENFFVPGDFPDDSSLLDQGIIDSTGVLELADFIETKLGIQVLDEEILPENFDSVASLATFVERKRETLARAC